MKNYKSLFKNFREQQQETVFAHFFAINGDYNEPFAAIARSTMDGLEAWNFHQNRFKEKYKAHSVPKIRNYLNYTFKRLVELERESPGQHFSFSSDGEWITFNTGLQNKHGADLLAVFSAYKANPDRPPQPSSDWVYKGCFSPTERQYIDRFQSNVPDIAWYSKDSRDFVFNTQYAIEKDVFDHLFDRAKERAGLPNAPDDVVRNYLRGAIENLIPKIKRNYKVAIPIYYVEEGRMQLLLPFQSVISAEDISCFLVDRDDDAEIYRLKTILDLDHAYFAARLITRPDKDWLNP